MEILTILSLINELLVSPYKQCCWPNHSFNDGANLLANGHMPDKGRAREEEELRNSFCSVSQKEKVGTVSGLVSPQLEIGNGHMPNSPSAAVKTDSASSLQAPLP
ncbi:hypothetical protein MRB53_020251 [Persea americana]|uniref:Uncharacterized protein n=1 Tax=Persea americana TaxID=3435 RepID=A0ACC2L0E8_PERAE|nr:hypothetical protein MRB53_020251 [Persea americana]